MDWDFARCGHCKNLLYVCLFSFMLVDGAITYILCNDLGFSFASSNLWKGIVNPSQDLHFDIKHIESRLMNSGCFIIDFFDNIGFGFSLKMWMMVLLWKLYIIFLTLITFFFVKIKGHIHQIWSALE